MGRNHFQFKISTSHKWILLSIKQFIEREQWMFECLNKINLLFRQLYYPLLLKCYTSVIIVKLLDFTYARRHKGDRADRDYAIIRFFLPFFQFLNPIVSQCVKHNGLFLLRKDEIFVNFVIVSPLLLFLHSCSDLDLQSFSEDFNEQFRNSFFRLD